MKNLYEVVKREVEVVGVWYIALWLTCGLCSFGENEFTKWWLDTNFKNPAVLVTGIICAIVFSIYFSDEWKKFKKATS